MEAKRDQDKAAVFCKRVKAGKRTYFFDVKSTKSNDYYLTITESKRKFKEDGFSYEKHKIFLYKEDFLKFIDALEETVKYVKTELLPGVDFERYEEVEEPNAANEDLKWD